MPLRQRREDILALAEYFLAGNANLYTRQDKSLSPEARTILLHYPWPGNVDELQRAMARCYEVTRGQEIQLDALPFALIFADCRHYPKSIWPALAQAKRRLIIKTLDLTQGIAPTARLLGIDRARLLCLIENLKIAQVTHVTDD
jgi:DNA-binding NtrC family response regulator